MPNNFFSRLNTEAGGGAWCPKSQIDNAVDGAEYLEIDLLSDHIIRNVNHIKTINDLNLRQNLYLFILLF